MTSDQQEERKTTNDRVAFDDDDDDHSSSSRLLPPQRSRHWESLVHEDGDSLLSSLEELKMRFRSNLEATRAKGKDVGDLMAVWSCIAGYCEALSTHKEATRRYQIFPLPISALERLVQTEFRSKILGAVAEMTRSTTTFGHSPLVLAERLQQEHRLRVRAVANAVWDSAVKSSKKDEEHANSLYVCLRGHIDQKSVDCLGSSVTTIAGLKMLQDSDNELIHDEPQCQTKSISMLTLSEDHAYESHSIILETMDNKSIHTLQGTCEVAIPGSTQKQKAKRACEIMETFREKYSSKLLTPESSWLYMATNAVICTSPGMALVPIIANINCTIQSKTPGGNSKSKASLESRQLYRLKRELLWSLYDQGAMKEFPFGMMELGDCEQTLGSKRGEEWTKSKHTTHPDDILKNEDLFLEAIYTSREIYRDAQVYPYYYAGHYHKDAGETQVVVEECVASNEQTNHEHRFVEALHMYSEAARVTSKYRFDTGDCLPLNKHVTTVATLIYEDILMSEGVPRTWKSTNTSVLACQQLFRWIDHLLYWEEWSLQTTSNAGLVSKNPQFVQILQPSHKSFVGKLVQTFSQPIRSKALEKLFFQTDGSPPRSVRLKNSQTLLAKAFVKAKVQVKEIDLAIVSDGGDDETGGRRKRRKRGA